MTPQAYNLAAGPAGALIDLGAPVSCLQVTLDSTARAIVRAQLLDPAAAAPSAPAATPLPAAPAALPPGWVVLESLGQVTLPADPYGVKGYRYIEVWYTAAGVLTAERTPAKDEL